MTVGERIEQKRKENNMSMEALGDLLGVGKSAINKWEKGYVQRISRSNILKMAQIFDCDPAWLGGYSDSDTSDNTNLEDQLINATAKNLQDKEFLERYHNASPETRNSVDLLIEADLRKHGLLD